MCAQFLEKSVSRKKAKYDLETFSGLMRLKHLGVLTIVQTSRQVWCQILLVFILESDFGKRRNKRKFYGHDFASAVKCRTHHQEDRVRLPSCRDLKDERKGEMKAH